jgi:hypothetical protein
VWVALAGRANEHGIAWPTIDTLAADAGTFTSTVRRALDWLIDVGWITVVESGSPRASARLRVNLEPVPPPAGHAERYPIKPKPRGSGALSEGARCALPGVAERVIRGSGASTEDHRKDHRKDHKEDPSYAPPRVAADGSGQALLFLPLDPPGDPPPPAELPPPPKPRRMPAKAEAAPKVPTAAERYAAAYVDGFAAEGKSRKGATAQGRYLDAFVAGIRDAGHVVSRPTASAGKLLGAACQVHALDGAGRPITGDALPVWIRSEAAAFRRAVNRPEFWKGGISVVGLIAWWDGGRRTQAPTFGPREPADDFSRPLDSDNWPEAQLVPEPVPRPRPARDDPPDPQRDAEIAALVALGPKELERRYQEAQGFAGVRS